MNYHREKTLNPLYTNPYGLWNVTTEGDVEARSTIHLGTYEGYIDEIALALADKCYYSLKFSKTEPISMDPIRPSVCISLDIDSGTWDMNIGDRINAFKEIFANRPDIAVFPGASYASVEIRNFSLNGEDVERDKALNKLTAREKQILGLN